MTKFIKVHSVKDGTPEAILINAEAIECVEPRETMSVIFSFAIGTEPSGCYEVLETVDEIFDMLNA